MIGPRTYLANPVCSTVNSYGPTASPGNPNLPSASVTSERSRFVSSLRTVTVAPETIPPWTSSTVPEIVPVVAWPNAWYALTRQTTHTRNAAKSQNLRVAGLLKGRSSRSTSELRKLATVHSYPWAPSRVALNFNRTRQPSPPQLLLK